MLFWNYFLIVKIPFLAGQCGSGKPFPGQHHRSELRIWLAGGAYRAASITQKLRSFPCRVLFFFVCAALFSLLPAIRGCRLNFPTFEH